MNRKITKFQKLAAQAVNNIKPYPVSVNAYPIPGLRGPVSFNLDELTFTRPNAKRGYGFVLKTLNSSKKPLLQKEIQLLGGFRPTSNIYVYYRLMAAKLIGRIPRKGYFITPFGKKYLKAWQHDCSSFSAN